MPNSISAMPADKLCTRCGKRKALDRFRRKRTGQEPRHGECNDCRNRMNREQTQARTKRSLRMRRTATGLLDAVRALVNSCGGWERTLELVSPEERAGLALRCLELGEAERQRAEEAERRAAIDLQDKRLQDELHRMAVQSLAENPQRACTVLANVAPRVLVGALRQAGYTCSNPSTPTQQG